MEPTDVLKTIGIIASLALALGSIGAWLLNEGKRRAQAVQVAKDVDGIGRKIENVRGDLQDQIDLTKREHDNLAREVSEIKSMTGSTLVLVQKLVNMHMGERDDGR